MESVKRLAVRPGSVYIPDRGVVSKTDDDDPIDYYYKPLTRYVYRKRLTMTAALLGPTTYPSLLEIGYGSGILLPELARHTERLTAIDIHRNREPVVTMLKQLGVQADLRQADLYRMPFENQTFDGLFCLSVLEHLTELDRALAEFARVTKPGATLVFGFPVRNLVTDAFFRAVGYDPRKLHPAGHRDIERAIRARPDFRLDRRETFPARVPVDLALYCACRCVRAS
jgi:2-polyprenyl-3-methyl-5-hydroxy-6-metoxy-1,4-benzoquinol methylase